MFSSFYLEYFIVYMSVLISMRHNTAPEKKAIVLYRNDIQDESGRINQTLVDKKHSETENPIEGGRY
jgi:hypothetical protein